jgi:hypothetical protein
VAERSNAAVSKTVSGLWVRRGFKSLPLRFVEPILGSSIKLGWIQNWPSSEPFVEFFTFPAYGRPE